MSNTVDPQVKNLQQTMNRISEKMGRAKDHYNHSTSGDMDLMRAFQLSLEAQEDLLLLILAMQKALAVPTHPQEPTVNTEEQIG